ISSGNSRFGWGGGPGRGSLLGWGGPGAPRDARGRRGGAFAQDIAASPRLAFLLAYGLLRHREDAEDVAQEAFAKAYRSFRSLRDRDRFRAWLVRMTWRLAIDRIRSNRRRSAHAPPVRSAEDT